MNTHAYWTEYLKSARNGHDRPIHGSSTKRVSHGANGDVILRLHATDVVTLHADGTETIDTGGWNTVTTKAFIAEHSRARVWSESWQLFVRTAEPTLTPPRVRKCRRCQGGQCKQECYGPGWCYADHLIWAGISACEHGKGSTHRRTECEHGQTAAHALPSVDCWQCHGAGRFDYGSNPVHYQWDGGPLTIDAHGYPVGPAASVRRLAPLLAPEWRSDCDTDTYGERYPEEGLGKYASHGNYARLLADIDSLTQD